MKLVDLIIVVFGALVLLSCLSNKRIVEKNSFSSQTMNNVKGLFAILIVLFHLSQHIEGGILFKLIGDTGYLAVAVFFFISGYGMYTRILQSGGVLQKLYFS